MVTSFFRLGFLSIYLFLVNVSVVNASAPVLLTFDTEKTNDQKYLKELDIKVPATYFFLGKFIEQNLDFVTEIAKNNTVGSHAYSHANLKELSQTELHRELMLTKTLLEKATGTAPKWFRAPFLEYNEEKIYKRIQELGWEQPEDTDSNSSNCLLNSFANQVHIKKYGFHPYAFEVSGLIRTGVMTREEGIDKIEAPQGENTIKQVKEKLGI